MKRSGMQQEQTAQGILQNIACERKNVATRESVAIRESMLQQEQEYRSKNSTPFTRSLRSLVVAGRRKRNAELAEGAAKPQKHKIQHTSIDDLL